MKRYRLEGEAAVELDVEAAFEWYEAEDANLGFGSVTVNVLWPYASSDPDLNSLNSFALCITAFFNIPMLINSFVPVFVER